MPHARPVHIYHNTSEYITHTSPSVTPRARARDSQGETKRSDPAEDKSDERERHPSSAASPSNAAALGQALPSNAQVSRGPINTGHLKINVYTEWMSWTSGCVQFVASGAKDARTNGAEGGGRGRLPRQHPEGTTLIALTFTLYL
ncbi:unnamed protein product [Phyllotreta striolata]|uniref:Uncharacterized protein n=1 Tax=Phyllotreta striolata TaxID=444603 RepID=A0A9N9XTP6_PHYSR|nr:unnamed protein product [Phyllotreta striolata]